MGQKVGLDAEPVHTVTLSSFWIGQYEVTNAQFERFKKRPRRPVESTKDNTPVTRVTNDEAHAFCEWLTRQEKAKGRRYRLPTEAEWEYAARGGLEQKQYPWGDDDWMMPGRRLRATFGVLSASPVGSYPPNGFGLYDMAGNVREWVSDWYASDYYARSPSINPKGPKVPGPYPQHILRGGYFGILEGQVWNRGVTKDLDPESAPKLATFGEIEQADGTGFRVVCETKS